jgi:ABC-type uncharacterized transport system ATPase subunit
MSNNSGNQSHDDIVLDVQGVTKRFPGILANDHIDLTLRRGEILALLGENGAGKSTLMNIIYGLYHADEGTIQLKGRVVRFSSPREAIHSGIGMVHQHFQLIPVMTVAENVTLGEEQTVSATPIQASQGLQNVQRAIQRGWGALWRICVPILAVLIGLLSAQITLQIVFNISTRFLSDDITGTFKFQRMAVIDQAYVALQQLYASNPGPTTAALNLPYFIGGIVGAVIVVLGFLYAWRTWATLDATPDHIIDSFLDFIATSFMVQNKRLASDRVRDLSRQYGLEVDPDMVIEKLPIGMQQRVEIIKALYRHADILILDEPTAVLTPQESQELFKIMRKLAAEGVSIIFISHKLKEVLTIADQIVVMRGGKVVGATTPAQSTENSLAEMMVGREVLLKVAKDEAQPQNVVLTVKDLNAKDDRGATMLDGLNFTVRAGEILGIAGVQGNGQTELVEVLTGLRKMTGGQFTIGEQTFSATVELDPRRVTETHTAHIPEDRHRYGMILSFPVMDNLVLNDYYATPFASAPNLRQFPVVGVVYGLVFTLIFGIGSFIWTAALLPAMQNGLHLSDLDPRTDAGQFFVALFATLIVVALVSMMGHLTASFVIGRIRNVWKTSGQDTGGLVVNESAVDTNANALIKEFDIRTPSGKTSGGSLSGGNQQKMVVAREFSRKPRLLIASQPTRGIDVGAIEFIHQRIVKQRDDGAAVLLVSAELDEIVALSDRIAVMYRGQIIATVPGSSATREQLGLLMAGIKSEAPVAASQA